MINDESEINKDAIKIILVGNAGVGKTAIINRYYKNTFSEKLEPTISMNFIEKKINIDGKDITLNIWDTAGQEKYRSCNKLFIKYSKIVIFVYDITSRKSFDELEYWYNTIIDELVQFPYFILAGNKMDKLNEEQVSEEEGKECAKKWDAYFSLLSAKEDKEGIDSFFENIVKIYLQSNKVRSVRAKTIKLNKQEHDSIKYDNNSECCIGWKSDKNLRFIKIIFLGANGVGKTNIIKTILGKKINKQYEHTPKNTNYQYIYYLEDKKNVNVDIIEINGEYADNTELKDIFQFCRIYFLVFDVNKKETFSELNNWINNIKKYSEEKKILINILGNKNNNIPNEENEFVNNEEAEEFAKTNGGIYKMVSIEDSNSLKIVINDIINKYLNN